MPIRLLSLPGKDLQYALDCMDIRDLVAFSLCSERTKNLVKSSNRKIEPIAAYVYEDYIYFDLKTENDYDSTNDYISLYVFDSYFEFSGSLEIEEWRKEEFTQNDWIAHFLNIFNDPMIGYLGILNTSLSYLDTIKQLFPKCSRLAISDMFSRAFAKIAFWKLYSIAEKVEIYKNICDDKNDTSKLLTLSLKSLYLVDFVNPLKLNLDDLLILNITDVTIHFANISVKELNRFLKLWMQGNRTFYRPEVISLCLENGTQLNYEEVLKGIKYENVKNYYRDFTLFRLKRRDGKELNVFIADNEFTFRVV
ncbi:hypothetical protein B9Z55_021613 [Caenorhabditis nigoni]|uniref:F-box domain-containing protein n=1 Tax=Caenorhabditis nigoni TaxID=1611254 RepID=A0A2G5TST3_9PELO|nr:hypothetical protein B9Z55_021613 [Caenorhabditis nigoni]